MTPDPRINRTRTPLLGKLVRHGRDIMLLVALSLALVAAAISIHEVIASEWLMLVTGSISASLVFLSEIIFRWIPNQPTK